MHAYTSLNHRKWSVLLFVSLNWCSVNIPIEYCRKTLLFFSVIWWHKSRHKNCYCWFNFLDQNLSLEPSVLAFLAHILDQIGCVWYVGIGWKWRWTITLSRREKIKILARVRFGYHTREYFYSYSPCKKTTQTH